MKENLTFEEKYELQISLVVDEYGCEYYGCGSHKMLLNTKMSLENVQELYDQIKNLKGLKI